MDKFFARFSLTHCPVSLFYFFRPGSIHTFDTSCILAGRSSTGSRVHGPDGQAEGCGAGWGVRFTPGKSLRPGPSLQLFGRSCGTASRGREAGEQPAGGRSDRTKHIHRSVTTTARFPSRHDAPVGEADPGQRVMASRKVSMARLETGRGKEEARPFFSPRGEGASAKRGRMRERRTDEGRSVDTLPHRCATPLPAKGKRNIPAKLRSRPSPG